MNHFLLPLLGGVVIGIAASLMLFLNGRVAGVSGIVGGAINAKKGDFLWRIAFVLGLIFGGVVWLWLKPEVLRDSLNRSTPILIIAGLLVGYGTLLGSGCTSGHGICGVSRLSARSLVATATFILVGVMIATFFRLLTGVR